MEASSFSGLGSWARIDLGKLTGDLDNSDLPFKRAAIRPIGFVGSVSDSESESDGIEAFEAGEERVERMDIDGEG